MPKRKPSLAELDRILDSDEGKDVYILPNGEITTRKKRGSKLWKRAQQPLTAKGQNGHENLGRGTY